MPPAASVAGSAALEAAQPKQWRADPLARRKVPSKAGPSSGGINAPSLASPTSLLGSREAPTSPTRPREGPSAETQVEFTSRLRAPVASSSGSSNGGGEGSASRRGRPQSISAIPTSPSRKRMTASLPKANEAAFKVPSVPASAQHATNKRPASSGGVESPAAKRASSLATTRSVGNSVKSTAVSAATPNSKAAQSKLQTASSAASRRPRFSLVSSNSGQHFDLMRSSLRASQPSTDEEKTEEPNNKKASGIPSLPATGAEGAQTRSHRRAESTAGHVPLGSLKESITASRAAEPVDAGLRPSLGALDQSTRVRRSTLGKTAASRDDGLTSSPTIAAKSAATTPLQLRTRQGSSASTTTSSPRFPQPRPSGQGPTRSSPVGGSIKTKQPSKPVPQSPLRNATSLSSPNRAGSQPPRPPAKRTSAVPFPKAATGPPSSDAWGAADTSLDKELMQNLKSMASKAGMSLQGLEQMIRAQSGSSDREDKAPAAVHDTQGARSNALAPPAELAGSSRAQSDSSWVTLPSANSSGERAAQARLSGADDSTDSMPSLGEGSVSYSQLMSPAPAPAPATTLALTADRERKSSLGTRILPSSPTLSEMELHGAGEAAGEDSLLQIVQDIDATSPLRAWPRRVRVLKGPFEGQGWRESASLSVADSPAARRLRQSIGLDGSTIAVDHHSPGAADTSYESALMRDDSLVNDLNRHMELLGIADGSTSAKGQIMQSLDGSASHGDDLQTLKLQLERMAASLLTAEQQQQKLQAEVDAAAEERKAHEVESLEWEDKLRIQAEELQIERKRSEDSERQLERKKGGEQVAAAGSRVEVNARQSEGTQWQMQLQDTRSQYAELSRAAQVEYREAGTRADLCLFLKAQCAMWEASLKQASSVAV